MCGMCTQSQPKSYGSVWLEILVSKKYAIRILNILNNHAYFEHTHSHVSHGLEIDWL